jgi:hypothetical protein
MTGERSREKTLRNCTLFKTRTSHERKTLEKKTITIQKKKNDQNSNFSANTKSENIIRNTAKKLCNKSRATHKKQKTRKPSKKQKRNSNLESFSSFS